MTNSNHIAALKKIISDDDILTNDNDKASYETPWRGEKGSAAFVIRPKTTSEVSKIVAYFTQHNIPFITQSGNTGLVYASTPDQSGKQAVLSLERLNEVFDINIANKSAYVGAGVRLSQLNLKLEDNDLFFPIDLSSDPCIGGMVATNTGGSRLLKYGGVRENLLGLKVVLPDKKGTIIDLTHKLHKNNTGLDLKQLFVCNGGQNSIITECVVSLSPLPKQIATALLVPVNNEAVSSLLIELEKRFGHELSAFEGMSKNAIEAAFAHNAKLKNGFKNNIPDYTCLIEISRSWEPRKNEASIEETLQTELSDVMEKHPSLLEDVLLGHPEDHWALRHSISGAVQKSGKMISFDISFPRDESMSFRSFIIENLPKNFPDIKICDFGHIGDGAMHLNLVISPDDRRLEDHKFIPLLRQWVLDCVVTDFNGSYSAEHGNGPLNQDAFQRYTPEVIKKLMSKIQNLCSID